MWGTDSIHVVVHRSPPCHGLYDCTTSRWDQVTRSHINSTVHCGGAIFRDVARIIWIWVANFGWSLNQKLLKRKKISPQNFWDKHSKKHKPRPKRANGLHFVGGLCFCLGGLSPPSPCLATSLAISHLQSTVMDCYSLDLRYRALPPLDLRYRALPPLDLR